MHLRYLFSIVFICFISTSSLAQVSVNIPKDAKATKGKVNLGGTVKIYPNPADTYFNLYVNWDEAQTFKVAIYDNYDALIKEWSESVRDNYQHSVDVTQLPEGEYYLVIEGAKGHLYAELKVSHKKK